MGAGFVLTPLVDIEAGFGNGEALVPLVTSLILNAAFNLLSEKYLVNGHNLHHF